MCAADQFMNREICDFARNVPQGDIDTGQGLQRHALLPVVAHQVVNLVPNYIAIHRVHAKDHWLNDFLNNAFVGQSDRTGAETLAPSGDPLISFDFDQMACALGIELLRIP